MIIVKCFGKTYRYRNREHAIRFYQDCLRAVRGFEERCVYGKIICDLVDGKDVCGE